MSQSVQCQAQLTPQRQCTNKTSSPDCLCHLHKNPISLSGNMGSGKAIPRVDGFVATQGSKGTVEFKFASLVPSSIRKWQENRKLRDAIRMAYPDTSLNLFEEMKLKEIHDTDQLRDILELTTTLFPERIDHHGNAMLMMDRILGMHRGALRDFISASEYIEDSYLGFHDAVKLHNEVALRFPPNVSNQDPIPNFAAHMKVAAFVRSLPDGFYGYWERNGLARVVDEHPEETEEIIEYVRTHEFDPRGYRYLGSRQLIQNPVYNETELQALFIHSALDEGVL